MQLFEGSWQYPLLFHSKVAEMITFNQTNAVTLSLIQLASFYLVKRDWGSLSDWGYGTEVLGRISIPFFCGFEVVFRKLFRDYPKSELQAGRVTVKCENFSLWKMGYRKSLPLLGNLFLACSVQRIACFSHF